MRSPLNTDSPLPRRRPRSRMGLFRTVKIDYRSVRPWEAQRTESGRQNASCLTQMPRVASNPQMGAAPLAPGEPYKSIRLETARRPSLATLAARRTFHVARRSRGSRKIGGADLALQDATRTLPGKLVAAKAVAAQPDNEQGERLPVRIFDFRIIDDRGDAQWARGVPPFAWPTSWSVLAS